MASKVMIFKYFVYGHDGEDDEREFPSVDEGVDEARGEDGHEEDEHADLLANTLLQLVQVPKTIILLRECKNTCFLSILTL